MFLRDELGREVVCFANELGREVEGDFERS